MIAAVSASLTLSMTSPARPSNLYLRFLQLAEAIRGLPTLVPLDPLEERILALIANANQRNERLSVRDLMAKDTLGAPATIHSRLKSMCQKGWIHFADTEDARRKQVALTDASLQHFEKLSHCMSQALAENTAAH